MQICPYCASKNIYFSRKNQFYLCEDCDKSFAQPSVDSGLRIFISYGHDDNQELVSLIKDYLTNNGYDIWIDTSCIPKGSDWRERITDGLIASNGVIAFLSRYSTRDPGVCLDELRIALRLKHHYVKAVLLENQDRVRPPFSLSDRQLINMEDWKSIPRDQWDDYFSRKMKELTAALESAETREIEEQINCLESVLSVFDPIFKEQMLLRELFVGRKWLAEQVQNLLEKDSNPRMIIFGVPGSGKSAFAANFSRFSFDVAASLYCSWDDPVFSSTDGVIKLLAYKLALGLNDYRRILTDLLKKDAGEEHPNLGQLQGAALFDWLILNPVSFCVDGNRGRRLVIIDGLDELCDEAAQLLFKKSALMPEWLRFLFTSRYDETDAGSYRSARTVMLDRNEADNVSDLAAYMSYRLGLPAAGKEIQRIKERLGGSFIYAKTLCTAVLENQIHLDDPSAIPYGLNEFYYDFMNRLFPDRDAYYRARSFFELLCVEDELSEP